MSSASPAGAAPLRVLTERLANDRGFVSMLGRASGSIAVAEGARPFVAAGLATLGSRLPVLVVTATAHESERYADDLRTWLGEQHVALFGAWETLPFERVSPATETMGRRLAVLEALGSPTGASESDLKVIVAPIRALLQRLSPDAVAPAASVLRVARGDRCDLGELVSQLVAWGYRREHQVEHRGEIAVRGGIVDVFCPTAEMPVRIDLWGDEVDRLTEFSIADQRSVSELAETQMYPAREMRPDGAMRERAAALAISEPWCREHMERLSRGELFDGMESWLPWLAPDEIVLPDLIGPDALVLLCEPRRLADRAADITAETDDLTSSLAVTWGLRSPGDSGDHHGNGPDAAGAVFPPAARCVRPVAGSLRSRGVVGGLHRGAHSAGRSRAADRHRAMGTRRRRSQPPGVPAPPADDRSEATTRRQRGATGRRQREATRCRRGGRRRRISCSAR